MKSLKSNFLFNLLKIFTNFFFPLVTFPYVSRILAPEGIGRIAFSNSIIAYFLMFANLGIPLYGIREVARYRNDKEKLSKVISEIFCLNLVTTVIISLIFLIFLKLNLLGKDYILFYIMSLNIFLTFIGIEWFYQGMEEYKYITMRSIFFKILATILLFLLIKTKEDIYIYAGITVFSAVGSNVLNFVNSRKFIKFSFNNLDIRRHLKPILTIFSMNIAISIYTNLDSVMLGYRSSQVSVGLYSSSIKLIHLVLGLVTALGAVMLPRIANYIENKQEEELKRILEKAFSFLLFISLPCAVGLYLTADEIILIFSGDKFREAVLTMKMLTPMIVFIAFSNFLGIQILYPRNQEKKVLISVIVGAIINFSFNWILIPKYAQNGAAFSTSLAEAMVILTQIFLGYKYLDFQIFSKNNLKYIIATILMTFGIWTTSLLSITNIYMILLLKIFIGGLIYGISLLVMRDSLTKEVVFKLLKRGKI